MKIGPLEVIICAFPKPAIDAKAWSRRSAKRSNRELLHSRIWSWSQRSGRRCARPRPARRSARSLVRNDP